MSRKSKTALNNPEVSIMKKQSEPIPLRMQCAAILEVSNCAGQVITVQNLHNTAQTYFIQLS